MERTFVDFAEKTHFLVVSHVDIQGRAGSEIHAKVVQTWPESPVDMAVERLSHSHHHF